MSEFKGVTIRKIEPITDEKGSVYEWCKGIDGKQISIFYRKKGIIAGNHYHKGDDPSKNPERFFLIKGKVEFHAINKKEELRTIIEQGHEIIIMPKILHSLKAITDIIFIEYRSTIYEKQNPDTYPGETYKEYIEKEKTI